MAIPIPARDDPRPTLTDPLLLAAAKLFEMAPWDNVTVEQAAAEADVPIADALARYPSSAYLARGIYAAVVAAIPARLAAVGGSPRIDLADRLCAIVATEIQLLEPYKNFVRSSIVELVNPTSPALALQAPLMVELLGYVADQIALARGAGSARWWVMPNMAAAGFGVLHAQLVTYWLTMDDAPGSAKTLHRVNQAVGLFVDVLQGPFSMALDFFDPAPSIVPLAASATFLQTKPVAGSRAAPAGKRARGTAKRAAAKAS